MITDLSTRMAPNTFSSEILQSGSRKAPKLNRTQNTSQTKLRRRLLTMSRHARHQLLGPYGIGTRRHCCLGNTMEVLGRFYTTLSGFRYDRIQDTLEELEIHITIVISIHGTGQNEAYLQWPTDSYFTVFRQTYFNCVSVKIVVLPMVI